MQMNLIFFSMFAGYYGRFVKDFSKITKPLIDLLPPTSVKKNRRKQEQEELKWKENEQVTFDEPNGNLTRPKILPYPDFDQLFELHIDACRTGLGGVLYNIQ